MKNYFITAFSLLSFLLNAQKDCKTMLIDVCIDGESKLHIKGGKLFWEHLSDDAPGDHKNCGDIKIKINKTAWPDWSFDHKLGFNTDNMIVTATVLKKNQTSQIAQVANKENNWETIWYFNDPAAFPHQYSVSFLFCPETITKPIVKKENIKPVKQKEEPFVKTDSVKEKKVVNSFAVKNDIKKSFILFFISTTTSLTAASNAALPEILDEVKNNSEDIVISGFPDGGSASAIKLYEDRAHFIYNYLVGKGVHPKRIVYLGYGNAKKETENRIEISLTE
ncbi:MAG: OmpA family protein [Bacteroidetes bacterium]|nr:OmpA family protein [Bacteroidota bacterium]